MAAPYVRQAPPPINTAKCHYPGCRARVVAMEHCRVHLADFAHIYRPAYDVSGTPRIMEDAAPLACVYFIVTVGREIVKVGRSTDPARRLYALQTASPDELRLAYCVFCSDAVATSLEWEAHRELERLGIERRGEWFATSAQKARAVTLRIAMVSRQQTFSSARVEEAVRKLPSNRRREKFLRSVLPSAMRALGQCA